MHQARSKEKVSKRRTEQLKNGVKVRYRCNKWKRTKCGFQMYSFYHTIDGPIELYETGVHDHSGRRLIEFEMNKRNKEVYAGLPIPDESQRPSQEDILCSLLTFGDKAVNEKVVVNVRAATTSAESGLDSGLCQDFLNNADSNSQENPTDRLLNIATARASALEAKATCASLDPDSESPLEENFLEENEVKMEIDDAQKMEFDSTPLEEKFSLKDDSHIAELLGLASDLDIFFTFSNKSGSDFEFRSNAPMTKRSVSLSDQGSFVIVHDRLYEKSVQEERWQKADWSQFLWALRGKCAYFLCESHKTIRQRQESDIKVEDQQ